MFSDSTGQTRKKNGIKVFLSKLHTLVLSLCVALVSFETSRNPEQTNTSSGQILCVHVNQTSQSKKQEKKTFNPL